jgi:hypothetical protein
MAILHPTMTPDLLAKMRRGGCRSLFYGLESGSQKVVDLMGKNFSLRDAATILRDTNKAGIAAGVFIMVGFPGETEADFEETLEFVRRNAPEIGRISTSLCDVQKGSHLDLHADEFGIETPILDRQRWRLKDGSNTDEIRRERHRRLRDLIARLGSSAEPKPTIRVMA